ncbi:MAG: hypothetical protein MZV63_45965 [Marinilabiliales bacterium]|nr:hypothetical protein [Marinilabiliales bacterium]
MAGPKGSKYYDIFLKQQLQLVTREEHIVINEEGFKLLTEIRNEQSIVAAAQEYGYQLQESLRDFFVRLRCVLGFPLVGKHRGGKDGGKTELSC